MSADLSLAPAHPDPPRRRCTRCSALILGDCFCLSWEYGNGRMIFLYYCMIDHLPANRRAEARRYLDKGIGITNN